MKEQMPRPDQRPDRVTRLYDLWEHADILRMQDLGHWHVENPEGRFCAPFNRRNAPHQLCGFELGQQQQGSNQICFYAHMCNFCECPGVNLRRDGVNRRKQCSNFHNTCCLNRMTCPGAYAAHMGRWYRYRQSEDIERREREFEQAALQEDDVGLV